MLILPTRLIKQLVMFPIEVVVMFSLNLGLKKVGAYKFLEDNKFESEDTTSETETILATETNTESANETENNSETEKTNTETITETIAKTSTENDAENLTQKGENNDNA